MTKKVRKATAIIGIPAALAVLGGGYKILTEVDDRYANREAINNRVTIVELQQKLDRKSYLCDNATSRYLATQNQIALQPNNATLKTQLREAKIIMDRVCREKADIASRFLNNA